MVSTTALTGAEVGGDGGYTTGADGDTGGGRGDIRCGGGGGGGEGGVVAGGAEDGNGRAIAVRDAGEAIGVSSRRPNAASISRRRDVRPTRWSRATSPHSAPSLRKPNVACQRAAKPPFCPCAAIAAPTSFSDGANRAAPWSCAEASSSVRSPGS